MGSNKILKAGVVGCGNMGRNHLRVLSTMHEYELVGCFDVSEEAAKTQAELYGIKAYASMEELFDDVDVAHIVTPSFLHHDVAINAAEHGCHVLVEKPIALTASDAREIIEACAKNDVRLCVGHVERFNPAITALSQVLASEDVIAADFRRMSPYFGRVSDASVVQDLMIHDIDVLNSIASSPVKSVAAHGFKMHSDKLDYCQALVTFEDGLCASLTASRVTEAKIRTADIDCVKAHVSLDYIDRKVEVSRKTSFQLDAGHDVQYKQENIIERVVVPNIEPLRAEFAHFAHCIETGEEVLTSGEMGLKALELSAAIEEAANA